MRSGPTSTPCIRPRTVVTSWPDPAICCCGIARRWCRGSRRSTRAATSWQRFYYQTYSTTGRPLSQYFASSSPTSGGGFLALGFTENPNDFAGELLAVKTDSAGPVGACGQLHPGTPLDALDPGLATIAPALPVQTTRPAEGDLPSRTLGTSIGSTGGQC